VTRGAVGRQDVEDGEMMKMCSSLTLKVDAWLVPHYLNFIFI